MCLFGPDCFYISKEMSNEVTSLHHKQVPNRRPTFSHNALPSTRINIVEFKGDLAADTFVPIQYNTKAALEKINFIDPCETNKLKI